MAAFTDRPPKFTFTSSAFPDDTFTVVHFQGSEGLSWCYDFEIELVSDQRDLDLEEIVSSPACFTIKRDGQGGDVPFHGLVSRFEQRHYVGGYAFYRARLMPRLWWLHYTRHNQIFLNKSLEELLSALLDDAGFSGADYGFSLVEDYGDPYEYVCQYGESHLNFFSRWLQHQGLYYYFEQDQGFDKLMVTDNRHVHGNMAQGKDLKYAPPSGLTWSAVDEVLVDFKARVSQVPAKLTSKDYNYRTPSLDLTAEVDVVSDGQGEVYLYGQHARTKKESQRLAEVRAQAHRCRQMRYLGRGSVPYVRTGYIFSLKDHYRDDFNTSYMVIRAQHEGHQVGYLISGLRSVLSKREQEMDYRNSFEAVDSSVQYRSRLTSRKPAIQGFLSAKIDASGTGQYAQLDEWGRYKIKLPFDESGRGEGKASAWMRMMQPYQGTNYGMHCPLHKGTEIMLTFVEGDPDRPIIASAAPNPEKFSPVTSANSSQSMLRTGGQNMLRMEDKAGKEQIFATTPNAGTYFTMGDPAGGKPPEIPGFDGLDEHMKAAQEQAKAMENKNG
ncbi:MAG: type VI secretion system Vgr family protein [Desulfovibrio sp.]|uniref:type VI secretion system Vgr family protein n=1 Tax=Desulfovibrio sp. 7SRBS1 TaxID=3378064 RepID=UPI003B40079C